MPIKVKLAKIESEIEKLWELTLYRYFEGRTEEELSFFVDHGYWPQSSTVKQDEHQLENNQD